MRRVLMLVCLVASVVPIATAASATPLRAASGFEVRGSVEQVSTTGQTPGANVMLLDENGSLVEEGPADTAGAKLFRDVAPGPGYQVRSAGGSTSDPVTVTAGDENPDDAFYADTAAADPLEAGYGYLSTRDGTTLSVNVTFPVDGSAGPWPVVVNYSGYDPSQPGSPPRESLMYAVQGYVVVGVNMRGTGCSGGAFDFMETLQSTDGYDMVETLAHQPWSNGDVGLVGISYSGYSQLYVAATQPPHLDAITPLSPYSDTYSAILYPGGILNNGFAYEWATDRENNAKPLARGWARDRVAGGDTECAANQALRLQSKPLLSRIRATPFADHEFDYLNTETFVDQIKVPTFLSSQWQDEQTGGSAANLVALFDPGTKVFASFTNGTHVEPMSPSEAYEAMVFIDLYVGHRVPHINPILTSVMPGVLADLFKASSRSADFSLPPDEWSTSTSYQAALATYEARPRVRIRWENGSIPGKEGLPIAPVTTRYANWPIDGTTNQKIYLEPDGGLGAVPPEVPDDVGRAFSSYTYDPASKRAKTSDGGTESQWAPHPDVSWNLLKEGNSLSFVTQPYDHEVAYAGQGSADLWLRSAAADTDLEVTLTEVRPDGQEVYIQSGWLRASHRAEDPARSTELVPYQDHQEVDAAPLPAGQFTKVRVELFPFAHVIRPGSRLRVNIEAPGGNQPFWAFEDLPGTSVNDIGHSSAMPSRVVLPLLPPDAMPQVPAALPACQLAGVSSQSVSLRNQPCRGYQPARIASGVVARPDGDHGLRVSWTPPAGPAPTTYRVVAELAAGAPSGATAPAPIEVAGGVDQALVPAPDGVALEFRVVAVFQAVAAPASDASLPVAGGPAMLRLFGSWRAFAERQLIDFTGSAPAKTVQLDAERLAQGLSPQDYVASLRRGRDARTSVDPVVRLIVAYFHRSPTATEVADLAARRRSGTSLATISRELATSAEFSERYGSLSNKEFVALAFANTGRQPGRLESWLATVLLDLRLMSRSQLMLLQTESQQFRVLASPYVDAVVVRSTLLGRAATDAEAAADAQRLSDGTTLAEFVDELLRSPDYASRIAG